MKLPSFSQTTAVIAATVAVIVGAAEAFVQEPTALATLTTLFGVRVSGIIVAVCALILLVSSRVRTKSQAAAEQRQKLGNGQS